MVLSIDPSGISTAFAANNISESDAALEDVTASETDASEKSQYTPISLESLIDEEGFLTDEGLLSLQCLPYDEEKYTEIIDNGDGTQTLRLYTEPVKYKNDAGEYEYIDNSVIEASTGSTSEQSFETANSDVEVRMSDNLNQADAIRLSIGDYDIGFQPLDILTENGESSAGVSFVEAQTGAAEDTIDAVEECGSVVYSKTFDENTDIVITPTSTGLKEEIVLYEIPTETQYSYDFTVDGVVPILRRDGNLYFVDLEKGLQVAAIPTPNMCDSTPESGPVDIPVTLEKTGENEYRYTLFPDRAFLENAVYPVTIDPTISSTQAGGIYDTYVQSNTSTNYCNGAKIIVGRSTAGTKFRGLIKITPGALGNLQATMAGCTLTQVLYHAYNQYGGASYPLVEVRQIPADWVYNTVRWSNQPALGNIVTSQTVHEERWYDFNITTLGAGWINGSVANTGILLKIENESLNQYKEFTSNESSSGNKDYFDFIYYDGTGPNAPVGLYTSPNATSSWTNNASPVIGWSSITDVGYSGFSYAQYNIDGGAWRMLPGNHQIEALATSGTHTIHVRGVDAAGNAGQESSIIYKYDGSFSSDAPQPTVNVTNGALNSGDSAQISVTFSTVTDSLSGTSYYQILENGVVVKTSASAGTVLLTGRNDYTTYSYAIRVYDNAGNASAPSGATLATTLDRTGPIIEAADVTISPGDWTSGNPMISWGTISDPGGGATNSSEGTGAAVLKYQIGGTAGAWLELGDYGDGSATIDAGLWTDGEHSIYIAAFDQAGNISNTNIYLVYKKDAANPEAEITLPQSENVVPLPDNTTYKIYASAADANIVNWKLDYALGTNPASFPAGNVIAGGTTNLESINPQIWDLTGLDTNRYYTLRLSVEDLAGNKKKRRLLYITLLTPPKR
jgi:hypothetical protein